MPEATAVPAALTPQTRARLADTIRDIECIGGEGEIASVLEVLLAESARADAALTRVEELTGRVEYLETALDNLMVRLADAYPMGALAVTVPLHPVVDAGAWPSFAAGAR